MAKTRPLRASSDVWKRRAGGTVGANEWRALVSRHTALRYSITPTHELAALLNPFLVELEWLCPEGALAADHLHSFRLSVTNFVDRALCEAQRIARRLAARDSPTAATDAAASSASPESESPRSPALGTAERAAVDALEFLDERRKRLRLATELLAPVLEQQRRRELNDVLREELHAYRVAAKQWADLRREKSRSWAPHDVMPFWSANEKQFPNLALVAKCVLATPATSNGKSVRLRADRLSTRCFLRSNA